MEISPLGAMLFLVAAPSWPGVAHAWPSTHAFRAYAKDGHNIRWLRKRRTGFAHQTSLKAESRKEAM